MPHFVIILLYFVIFCTHCFSVLLYRTPLTSSLRRGSLYLTGWTEIPLTKMLWFWQADISQQAFRKTYVSYRNGRMMMMINCFRGMVDQRKTFSLISSRDHCQRFSPWRISNTPRPGFEPAQNLSSGLDEWSCLVVVTTTLRSNYSWRIDSLHNRVWGTLSNCTLQKVSVFGIFSVLLCKSSYTVCIQENTDQKIPKNGCFYAVQLSDIYSGQHVKVTKKV